MGLSTGAAGGPSGGHGNGPGAGLGPGAEGHKGPAIRGLGGGRITLPVVVAGGAVGSAVPVGASGGGAVGPAVPVGAGGAVGPGTGRSRSRSCRRWSASGRTAGALVSSGGKDSIALWKSNCACNITSTYQSPTPPRLRHT